VSNADIMTIPGEKKIKYYLVKFQSLIALLLMAAAMCFLSDTFLTKENAFNIMQQISVNVCLSVGMTLVILTGGIDLSVGSVLAFCGAFSAGLLKGGIEVPAWNLYIGFTFLGAALAGIGAGSLLGACNGIAITKFKVPPFVATLAMLTIARGMTMLWTGGFPVTGLGTTFQFLGMGRVFGIPMPVWISAFIVAVAAIAAKKTRFGRHVYAVGGNEKAAKLSGLDVDRIKIMVYTAAGALAAVGALIQAGRLDSATPDAGKEFELNSIAAVVIGGTSLSGGKGSILGTVQGALIIGVLNNGLVLLNVSPFWRQVIKGLVILIAVIIDRLHIREKQT
jgi:ribose transport system permease protein